MGSGILENQMRLEWETRVLKQEAREWKKGETYYLTLGEHSLRRNLCPLKFVGNMDCSSYGHITSRRNSACTHSGYTDAIQRIYRF